MSDVMHTNSEAVDLHGRNAMAAMQHAFKSDIEKDLTRGTLEPTAQFSRVDHVTARTDQAGADKQDQALLVDLIGSDEAKMEMFADRLLGSA
jgi:hypothetical protein